MNGLEIFLVVVLTLLVAAPWVAGYQQRDPVRFWSPLTVISAVYAYYFLLGPLASLALGLTTVIRFDAAPFYHLGWMAGILGLACTYLGFALPVERIVRVGRELAPPGARTRARLRNWTLVVGFVGLLAWIIGTRVDWENPFANYLYQASNVILAYFALAVWERRRDLPGALVWAGVPFVLFTVGLAQIGFRGPIMINLIAVGYFWYLARRQRPRAWLWPAGAVTLVALSGAFVLTRSYYGGLDLAGLQKYSWAEILFGGVSDSVTFGALSAVIARVPSVFPFHYGEFLWVTATFPIPRLLWPGKPVAEYLTTIQYCVDANLETDGSGMAVPNIGEYYLAFGWVGIAAGSLVLGLLCRWAWRWYLRSPDNPLVLLTYGAFCGWLFQVIHRGYLPFAVNLFAFTVLPAFLLARHYDRRARLATMMGELKTRALRPRARWRR